MKQKITCLSLRFISQNITRISNLRRENNEIKYLRPDSKSQVTFQYSDNNKPEKILSIVISTQHDDFDSEENMLKKINQILFQS